MRASVPRGSAPAGAGTARYGAAVLVEEAWRHLGIAPTSDRRRIRAAYLTRLRAVHPDVSPSPTANDATVALLGAYEAVMSGLDHPDAARRSARPADDPAAGTGVNHTVEEFVGIAMMADDTIGIALPPNEAYAVALDAASRLGDVIHVEPSGGLLQVMLDLRDLDGTRRLCQFLVVLQGRGTGVTELHCAIESLDAAAPPPIDAVTELFVDELVAGN